MASDHEGYITEQEYLVSEKLAEEKHEYVNGKVYAIPQETRLHNSITLNVVCALRPTVGRSPCHPYCLDIKVRVQGGDAYYYPDVMVSCEQDDAGAYYLEKPCLLVEVTSKSTQWKDYAEKALAYRKLASLQMYLIVEQDHPQVTVYYRDEEGAWAVTRYDTLDQAIAIPCPEMSLALADIYEGVTFAPSEPEDS